MIGNKKHKSILLYKDWYLGIKNLSLVQKGELLTAIFEYNINNIVVSDISEGARTAFDFMKNYFDENDKKYDEISEKNRVNANTRYKKARKPSHAVAADNDNDNDNDTDNVNEKNNYTSDFDKSEGICSPP